jgi:hypothetical protein
MYVRSIWCALVLVFGFAATASAEPAVLVERVPAGASSEVVMSVMRQAFVGRRWTIQSETESSVTASLRRAYIESVVTLTYKDGTIWYDAKSHSRPVRGNPAQNPRVSGSTPMNTPENWVENLKLDISAALSVFPKTGGSH